MPLSCTITIIVRHFVELLFFLIVVMYDSVSLTLMVCLSTVSSSWRRVKPRLPHTLVRLIVNCPTADLCKLGSGGRFHLLQIWTRWPFATFANLDEVVVFIVFFWKNLHLELRRAVSTGWRRDIVESSSGLHSLQTGISSRALTNVYLFGCFP